MTSRTTLLAFACAAALLVSAPGLAQHQQSRSHGSSWGSGGHQGSGGRSSGSGTYSGSGSHSPGPGTYSGSGSHSRGSGTYSGSGSHSPGPGTYSGAGRYSRAPGGYSGSGGATGPQGSIFGPSSTYHGQRPSRDFHNAPPDYRAPTGRDRGEHHGYSQRGRHDGTIAGAGKRFHGRSYEQFSRRDHDAWNHGSWRHGWHHGHNGWWWYVDGSWFFYNTPIYPYPTWVGDYYDDDYDNYGSDYYWYWCNNPPGYYPYVRQCYDEWVPVPPTPY